MIEPAFAILTGIFAAVGTYLILSRALIRIVIGIVLLGNGVNLLIFVAGRLGRGAAPVLPASGSVRVADVVNP
ncbi:MAG TPA: NADH-quinone oxidoreductase subunit K, partial [Rhodanobacter sp.]